MANILQSCGENIDWWRTVCSKQADDVNEEIARYFLYFRFPPREDAVGPLRDCMNILNIFDKFYLKKDASWPPW